MNSATIISQRPAILAGKGHGDVLISVEGVGKTFCRDLKRSLWQGVQDIVGEVLPLGRHDPVNRKLRRDEFWAVKDVSFELRRGECMALIGRNGAGKTTLLKILNGLIKPDQGRVELRGRIGAMIALGAGFNPVLTGRENIYVTGSIRGMSKKEIDERIEDIIDFSEIRDFIDMPVQSYSSGMQVRLGFSVATALSPDIMLIDEVLAVGDGAFRLKCLKRIAEMMKTSAVILVSHNMQQIAQACSRGLVMEKGRNVGQGTATEAIELYNTLNETGGAQDRIERYIIPPIKEADIVMPERCRYGETFEATAFVDSSETLPGFYLLHRIFNSAEQLIAEISSEATRVDLPMGKTKLTVQSEKIFLKPGKYTINTLMQITSSPEILARLKNYELNVVGEPIPWDAHYQMAARLQIVS